MPRAGPARPGSNFFFLISTPNIQMSCSTPFAKLLSIEDALLIVFKFLGRSGPHILKILCRSCRWYYSLKLDFVSFWPYFRDLGADFYSKRIACGDISTQIDGIIVSLVRL